ncbi:TerD family protein [Lachnospiraceae bacterium 66-29]
MIDIPMRTSQPLDCNSILNINIPTQTNQIFAQAAVNQTTVKTSESNRQTPSSAAINRSPAHSQASNQQTSPQTTVSQAPVPTQASIREIAIPILTKKIQKGQKIALDPSRQVRKIQVCLGWNVTNPQCDLDVSAFILGANGKVLGDDWFVFYGQEDSPDRSVHFSLSNHTDREYISVDFGRLNPAAAKIVFVLTINEAFTHKLNFSMVKDAYIRILNAENHQELVSFQMTDYYPNVISMMIGEIYLYHGTWKCNAIGNGVARDLEGLCQLYGVQTV